MSYYTYAKDELKEIQANGHLNIQKTDKKKKTKTNSTLDDSKILEDNKIEKEGMSGKQLRKKRKKIKKKQIKKMEKMGMSPQKKKKKMTEIMNQKKGVIQEKAEENIDVDNFDIDELIERPRVSSIPKININLTKDDDNYMEEEDEDNYNYFENPNPLYNINFPEYQKNLQRYIKEKARILHDEEYRRNMIAKNNILTAEVSDIEKW